MTGTTRPPTAPPARPAAGAQLLAMLKVGVIGFGGGSALIPVMDDELVRRRRVLDEATFTRHTVVASITPGALPVKLGGLAGMHTSGAWLCLLMAVAVALPGTALTVGLVATVARGGQDLVRYVEMASVGITVFIIALLVHYIDKVVRHGAGSRTSAVVITVGAFVATGLPPAAALAGHLVGQDVDVDLPLLSAVQLIAAALVFITARALLRRQPHLEAPPVVAAGQHGRQGRVAHATLLLLGVGGVVIVLAALAQGSPTLVLLGLVALSTLTSFGGGEAYVGVADGFFVGGGYVASEVFYGQLVPIANALPGPILVKLAAGIGFAGTEPIAGPGAAWAVAAAAALVAVTSCTAVAVLVMGAYHRAEGSPVVRDIGAYILPVICGLLLTTSVSMLNASAEVAERADVVAAPVLWASLAGVAAATAVRHRRVLPDVVLLLLCGAVSTAALLAAASG